MLTLVVPEGYLRLGKCCHSDLRVSWHSVRSWVILLICQTSSARRKTGDADDTISLDAKRCPWCSRGFSDLLNLNYEEYLFLFRRAAANLQVDLVPYQGRHSGVSVDRAESLRTFGVHTKTQAMEISQVCTPLRVRRTCQPKLVRVRSIGPGTLRALQQPPALGFASLSCLTEATSTASSFVIDLVSAGTDLQRFFLKKGVQCARLEPFHDDNRIFDEHSRDVVHLKRCCASGEVVGPSP